MGSQRPERVQEAIRQESAKIIQELKDPRLGFLTVTKVELTKDLRFARIFFSTLGEHKDKELALKGLRHAKGRIKSQLSEVIKLRYMPEIEFAIDDSYEQIKKISDILDKANKEKPDEESDRRDQEI